MQLDQLKPNVIVRGAIFPEPVQVIVVVPMGNSVKLIGKGLTTGKVHEPILNAEQLASLEATPDKEPFDGDALRFRLGIEALRLGLAYEYDPYFSLSIARVDPLPHQLEAVYDYFLKLPRIRFLLADDPGAGKTIMAGLLLKELKIRGLVQRTLIVTPANLSFQWQRELKDKFRENFEVIRSDVLRANYGRTPGRIRTRSSRRSPGSRASRTPRSLLRSHWDLIIVDEAHKMSAYSADKKTLAYQLGESLSQMTDHYLLMTATPHKGDPENFCLFLSLLDRDVYGDVKSLEEAMRGTKRRSICAASRKLWSHSPIRTPARSRSSSPRGTSGRSRFKSATTNSISTTPDPLRRGPVHPRRGEDSPAAAPSASRWRCSSAASRLASTPCAAAWSGCGTSARRSWTIPRSIARSRSTNVSPTTSTTCPRTSSRKSSPSSKMWSRPSIPPPCARKSSNYQA